MDITSTVTATPTIVLVHGAWHQPSSYSSFTTALRRLGHEVHVPRLLSMNGTRPPNAGLEEDSDLIRTYVESLVSAGREVLVLLHSYGGQVGTNALSDGLGVTTRRAQGLPGGIVQLVYIAGFAVTEGTSMVDVVVSHGHGDLMDLAFDFAADRTVISRDPKNLVVGPSERSDEETDAYIATLQRWNGNGFDAKLQHVAWRPEDGGIPQIGYICSTQDMTVPLDYQKGFIKTMQDAGCQVRTWELETGHCPMFTKCEEVVKIVHELAEGK
ncbi:alpha/beta-hydrolase [Aspergillus steynii IBT 23096]|uniref:Alpha/beta-hydrolase n=1 Tax=Aspergillus steynii IBT 23096 TaxID=1392250 RepID=A0A2I2FWE0_9EURO|nr:alpha/beta-hydrolase [Aspergillus steynii IBT 23096]PLB44951.1 alpha/beta-hydrolase [Aspergillus steynii IBT 23096]